MESVLFITIGCIHVMHTYISVLQEGNVYVCVATYYRKSLNRSLGIYVLQ